MRWRALLNMRPRNLRLRIIAYSIIPTAVILLAVALVTFYAYQRVTADLVIGRNRELTRLSAGQLATDVSQYPDLLASIARTLAASMDDPDAQRAALSQAHGRLVVFDGGTAILNRTGTVVATEPASSSFLHQDWSGRAYFQQVVRTGRPVFSDVVNDGPGGVDVVVVAVPIEDGTGTQQGVLAGMFRLGATEVSAFYGGIVKLRIGDSGQPTARSYYLVDSKGHVIYHSDPTYTGRSFGGQPAVQEVLARKGGDLRTQDVEGRPILASYAPVPGTPWGLVTEESWGSLLASSQGYTRFLYILLALGVLVPAGIVTISLKRITEPIRDLSAAAKRVAGGDFGQTIAVRTGDEIEELATQFNLMSAELEESYAHLERRVAARTQELAALNSIAAVVNRSLNLTETLRDALASTLEVTGLEAGAAYRLDEDGHTLLLMAHRGLAPELAHLCTQRPLTGAAQQAIAEEWPMGQEVASHPEEPAAHLLAAQGLGWVVNVPLTAKGKACGVLCLAGSTLLPLSAEQESLLAAIGQQIGMAMENARLYSEAEQSAAAAERNRLARDLHDAVSQTLFSASLIAEVLPRLYERNPEEGLRRLEELRQLTRGALAEMRTLLLELRPAALTEAALGDLLRQLSEAITGRSRVPVSLSVTGEGMLGPEVRVALYRIAQEALNNVAKHSGAAAAAVSLQYRPDGHGVTLTVSDNGQGFDPESVTSEHLGLGIMRERAEAIGAGLRVETKPGAGTRITVDWEG